MKTKGIVNEESDDEDIDEELKPLHHQFDSENEYGSDSDVSDSNEVVIHAPTHTHRHARAAHSTSADASIKIIY